MDFTEDERVGVVPGAVQAEEEEEGVQAKQVSFAGGVPVAAWQGYVEVLFLTRWSAGSLRSRKQQYLWWLRRSLEPAVPFGA